MKHYKKWIFTLLLLVFISHDTHAMGIGVQQQNSSFLSNAITFMQDHKRAIFYGAAAFILIAPSIATYFAQQKEKKSIINQDNEYPNIINSCSTIRAVQPSVETSVDNIDININIDKQLQERILYALSNIVEEKNEDPDIRNFLDDNSPIRLNFKSKPNKVFHKIRNSPKDLPLVVTDSKQPSTYNNHDAALKLKDINRALNRLKILFNENPDNPSAIIEEINNLNLKDSAFYLFSNTLTKKFATVPCSVKQYHSDSDEQQVLIDVTSFDKKYWATYSTKTDTFTLKSSKKDNADLGWTLINSTDASAKMYGNHISFMQFSPSGNMLAIGFEEKDGKTSLALFETTKLLNNVDILFKENLSVTVISAKEIRFIDDERIAYLDHENQITLLDTANKLNH